MTLMEAPIEIGSDVYYIVEPVKGTCWKCKIHAKVVDIYRSTNEALIDIDTEVTYNSSKIQKLVNLNELQNRTFVRDHRAVQKAKELNFNKAEKINSEFYRGYLYDYDLDKYYDSIEDYLSDCEWRGLEPEKWLYACREEPVDRINSEYFVNSIADEFDDDSYLDIKGEEELQKAIDRFYEVNSHIKVLMPDYGKVVIIDNTVLEN